MARYFRNFWKGALLSSIALSTPVLADWWEAKTNHFVVYSESEEDDARQFAQRLERFDNALRLLQSMDTQSDPGDANRLTVFRFGDTTDIARMAGDSQSGIAGFYRPRAGSPMAFVPARKARRTGSLGTREASAGDLTATTIFQHEYTHHFMLQNFPTTYPSWYIEGFAELYGMIDLKEDGRFNLGDPPPHRGYELLNLPPYPLTKLLNTESEMTAEGFYALYSTGWLLTHYLSFNKERQGQLKAYLVALNAGEDGLTAAKRVFGDLDTLEKELNRYKHQRMPGYSVIPPSYSPPKVEMRKLTDAEESVMSAHMRSTRGVDKKEAQFLADKLRKKGATYPNSLMVQLSVTEAEFDAKNLDLAEAAADRSLAIDPHSVKALLYKGMIAMQRAKTDPANYGMARTYFTQAAAQDRRDPRPLIEYYESYRRAGGEIPYDAVVALEKAFDFAAYDPSYRMLLTYQLLNEGKTRAAKNVLGPAAFAGDRRNKRLAKVYRLLDDGKDDEAREKMNAIIARADRIANGEDVGKDDDDD